MAARKQEVEAKLPLEEDGYEENDTGYVVTHRNPTEESEHFRKRCFLGRRFLGSCFLGRRFLGSCFFRSASGRVKATFSPPSLSSDSLLSSNHASLDFSAYISGSRLQRNQIRNYISEQTSAKLRKTRNLILVKLFLEYK